MQIARGRAVESTQHEGVGGDCFACASGGIRETAGGWYGQRQVAAALQRKARCAGCTECRCRGAIIGAVVGSGARREAMRLHAEIGRTHIRQRQATNGIVG